MSDWRRLKPEERVNLAINMSDVCIRICAEGVKGQNPNISEGKLIELVRERLMFNKRRKGLLRLESFNAFGLDYMFTGALAASYYGVARTTRNIDVVVAVAGKGWKNKLLSALKQAGLIMISRGKW
ncbi:MAG: hypothetical protein ACUVTB_01525 [Candidatus Bathycorpusculaceae bacterium]